MTPSAIGTLLNLSPEELMRLTRALLPGVLRALAFTVAAGAVVTGQPLRGYSVIPTPQRVELGSADITFDRDWRADASSLPANHIALRTLRDGLKEFHGVELKPASSRVIRLAVQPGAVATGGN
jgi:hypothetical protein